MLVVAVRTCSSSPPNVETTKYNSTFFTTTICLKILQNLSLIESLLSEMMLYKIVQCMLLLDFFIAFWELYSQVLKSTKSWNKNIQEKRIDCNSLYVGYEKYWRVLKIILNILKHFKNKVKHFERINNFSYLYYLPSYCQNK